LPGKRRGAPAGVDQVSAIKRPVGGGDGMNFVSELNLGPCRYPAAELYGDSVLFVNSTEVAVETGTVDLETPVENSIVRSTLLGHLFHGKVAVCRVEPETQSVLHDVVAIKVRSELEVAEGIVVEDLDRRFAHSVVKVGLPVDETDGELRHL
jgi:hypothetical protein